MFFCRRVKKRTVRVTPVSGNLVVQSVATLNPFFQQLRVVAVLEQVESRSNSSAGAAKVLATSANRLAPVDREKNIMSREMRKKLCRKGNNGTQKGLNEGRWRGMKYGQTKGMEGVCNSLAWPEDEQLIYDQTGTVIWGEAILVVCAPACQANPTVRAVSLAAILGLRVWHCRLMGRSPSMVNWLAGETAQICCFPTVVKLDDARRINPAHGSVS
jgi:hypothetical protein